MKLEDYLTMSEAAAAVGCSRRTMYRVVERIGIDSVITVAFGKQLIHKSKMPMLKKEYMPLGSEQRSKALVAYGHKGGTQKRINLQKAAKKA